MTMVHVAPQCGHDWFIIEVWMKQNIGPYGADWIYVHDGLWFRYPIDATLAKVTLGL